MCLANINIGDIYYPRNWDKFHNKTNSILVENVSTFVFQKFQKFKLYQYCNVNFLELIECIVELNLIMQDHVRRIYDHETDVRRICDHVAHSVFFVLLLLLSIAAFDIECFRMLKFQFTFHVLLFSTFTIFYFVLCI